MQQQEQEMNDLKEEYIKRKLAIKNHLLSKNVEMIHPKCNLTTTAISEPPDILH